MNTFVSALLGIGFGGLGTASVLLMFHLWGYPFDKTLRKSEAPRWLMHVHRGIGIAYGILYVVMMAQMVPRLLNYQVEFPPRTVAHIMLGITIGFLLFVKLVIIRFFRHLEEWMPVLGTSILLCTWLLLGLSVPFAFKERALRAKALGGDVTTPANLERLKRVLPEAGLPKEAKLDELTTPASLLEGRTALLTKCVQCHDLRTVIARPRGAKEWARTVERMADRPLYGDAIDEKSQWQVATYLIAISPELQQAAKKARAQKEDAKDKRIGAVAALEAPTEAFDATRARSLYDVKCSQCHELSDIEKHKWTSPDEVREVMERMVDNGLEASSEELDQLRQYVVATFVKGDARAAAAPKTEPPKVDPAPPATTAAPPTRLGAKKSPAATAATTAAAAPTAQSGEPTCGKKPLPDCPMQAWMKANAAGAATEDAASLASVLDRTAKLAPPGYGSWAQISNDGAAAARAGDIKGARAACSGCHNQYRTQYKAEMRARPLR